MTTNKSKKGFVWSEAKPTKRMRLVEYRQSLHDVEFQHFDYRKKLRLGKVALLSHNSEAA